MTRHYKVMQTGMGLPEGGEIRFRGRWVQQAGFKPGTRFARTILAPGLMELRVLPEPTSAAEFQAVIAAFDRNVALLSHTRSPRRTR